MSKIKQVLLTIWILVWSIPLNIFALVVGLGLLIIGAKPKKWGPAIWFEIGHGWGGLELGLCFFMTSDDAYYHTRCHETGHLLQQAIFGPFMPFIVSFPSASRYWLFRFNTQRSRYIYAGLLLLILLILVGTPFILSICFNIVWLTIITALLIGYVFLLCGWLILNEIPKFNNNSPEYDSFWVEGDATRRGEEFMKKYYPDVIE